MRDKQWLSKTDLRQSSTAEPFSRGVLVKWSCEVEEQTGSQSVPEDGLLGMVLYKAELYLGKDVYSVVDLYWDYSCNGTELYWVKLIKYFAVLLCKQFYKVLPGPGL